MRKLFTLMLALMAVISVTAREVYIIGDATPAEWELGRLDKTQMTEVSTDVFEWTGVLFKTNSEGFKILTQRDWNPGIHPSTAGLAINTAGSDLTTYSNEEDSKWTVTETAKYTIRVTFDTDNVLVECEKVADVVTDGFLQVSSADLLEDYAWKQNKGWIDAADQKVALTADIDLSSFNPWITIGTDSHKFIGTFDGGGYSIKNMTLDGSKQEQGFFGVIGAGATIKNLIMDASCNIVSTEGKCFAAFVGCCNNDGTINFENCGNEANVTGTQQNNAGFLGCNYGGTKLVFNNCYNTGKISGGRENGAFSGWCGGGATFNNCWNIGEVTEGETWARGSKSINNCYQTVGSDGGVTKIDASIVASGEFCYMLNGDQSTITWYQTLPDETHPVPFSMGGHKQVFANGELKCDGTSAGGELTYSNSSTSVVPPHTFEDGWCSVCGTINPDYMTAGDDGFFSIGNAYDLSWFAGYVANVNQSVNAKLTANIDYTDYKQGFIGISEALPFKGTFDGQEHTINIDIVNDDKSRTGLFAYINAATIKNLVVEGSATSAGNNCVGGLGGRSDGNGTLIENVIVKTAVSYTGSNVDATCGGFFANMEGSVTVQNCAFLGSINSGTAEGNGGLVGWAGTGSNNKYVNCLVAPVEYTKNGNSAEFARNNPSVTNCKYTSANDAKLASGELCYALNNGGDNWYQNLTGDAVDATPVPFSSHSKVYANASYNCDGTPKGNIVYENVNGESHDPHVIENGFCTVCNSMIEYVENYMTPAEDGYYEISDNKQMRWFAAMIKDYRNANNITENAEANAPVNARLMNDIDFTGVKDYEPIGGLWGQGNTRYAGTFDGQGFRIKNLVINLEKNEVGVFGVVADGAVIKNFTLDGSCSINGGGHVGIIGEVWRAKAGAEVHLECLGNEADITGTGNNVGGILGVNMMNGGYAKLYMTNCYSTGKIKGSGENGQLSGWTGDNSVIENCYAIGETENCDGFARRGGGSTTKNSFCDKDNDDDAEKVTAEQLASGYVAAKLAPVFRQNLGEEDVPCLDATHGIVTEISAAGWATQWIEDTDVTIPSGITAYAGVVNGKYLTLTAIEDKVKADEAVILKGDAGFYNFMPTTGAAAAAENDLLGSDGSVKGGAGIYALAKPEAEVGFFAVGESVTIPAGKAYLSTAAGVKGYLFSFDNETAIANVNVNDNLIEGAIYNIAGQRLSKMQKGINIVNGKKMLK
jgi:hypothetical protein